MKKILHLSLILILSGSVSFAQQVTTYAGTAQTSGYTSGLVKASSKFNQPYGMAYDTNGNLWISESGGHVIKLLDANGKIWARAGAYGQAGFYNASGITSKFSSPSGIAVGPSNEIYVADKSNHVIRKISPFTGLSNSQSVTVFAGRFTASGQNYTSYPGYANGGATLARFQDPTDVAVDDSGNVYVADQGNHVIRKITSTGTVSTIAGQANSPGSTNGNAKTTAQFSSPTGVYYDNGMLYIADLGNSLIRKLDLANNSVSTVVSGLWTPTDVVKIGTDYFISDQHRIRIYNGSSLSTYAGSYYLNDYGYQDGYDTAARFYNVKSIGYAGGNHLLIADQDNHVIRKVTVCQSFTPQVTVTGNTTFCAGDSVVLTGPSGYARYIWSTGDTLQTIVVKSSKSVSLTVKDGDSCSGTSSSISITSNSVPSSTFSLDGHACSGDDDTITFTGTPVTNANYNWDFDGAFILMGGGQGPYVVQWDTAGSKTVSLIVSANGCQSQTTHTMLVDTTPSAIFTARTPVCEKEGDTLFYTGNASASAKYTWNFKGATVTGGIGQGPIYLNWKTSGPKDLELVVKENQCVSPVYSSPVDVNPTPTAAFLMDTAACAGSGANVKFKGAPGSTTTFSWDFDSGTVSSGSGPGPYSITWNTPGWKTVGLIVTENNCPSALASRQIRIKKVPVSDFTVGASGCTDYPDSIIFTGDASAQANYMWNFDGGNIVVGSGAGPYLISWNSGGNKNITLQVEENGCNSALHADSILIKQGATSLFDVKSKLCQGEMDTITYTGNASSSATYTWDFVGANISSGSGQGPYIVNWGTGGKKNVSLIVSEGGCTSTQTTVSVNVIFMPLSYFEIDTAICTNDEDSVKFTGYASTSATFTWDFPDAIIKSGSGQGPYVLKWGGSGSKAVSLIIDDQGCISTKNETVVNVYDKPKKPNATLIDNYLYSSAKYGNQWYDSSGIVFGADGQKFYPSISGWYYVVVTNSHGCSIRSKWIYFKPVGIADDLNKDIRIYPNPFTDNLIIRLNSPKSGYQVKCYIYSAEGKLLLETHLTQFENRIDLQKLSAGIYRLKVVVPHSVFMRSLIKY